MFKNYFKTAWRSLKRQKTVSIINILGLAIGMAVALLIALWTIDELSFDKGFKNYDTVVQLLVTGTFSGETSTDASTSIPMGEMLRTQYAADFDQVAATTKKENHFFSYMDKKISSIGNFAQNDFLKIFTLNKVWGEVNQLNDPSSIILNQSFALSLFGKENPIGKVVQFDGKDNFTVSGVYEDLPMNSSFYGTQFIAPWKYYSTLHPETENNWNQCRYLTYALLKPGTSATIISKKIANLAKPHLSDIDPTLLVHPMSKWHLYETFKDGKNIGGKIQYIWMFSLIGIFVLLLACINFMNLATARSEKNTKEVGIMKVVGAGRKSIVYRFLLESLLTTIFAFSISILMVWQMLPWFNNLLITDIKIPYYTYMFWFYCGAFVVITALIAGGFPALYLSSFQVVKVLKGRFKSGKNALVSRKALVVFQFLTSTFLIIATIVVLQQIKYTKNRPLGYSTNGLINISVRSVPENKREMLKQEILKLNNVKNVAYSSALVNQLAFSSGGYKWSGIQSKEGAVFGTVSIDEAFAKTVSWKFKEGRGFSSSMLSDSSAVVINETAAKYMNIGNPLNKILYSQDKPYQIIGVIQDAVMGSPFSATIPTAFFLGSQPMNQMTIALSLQHDMSGTINNIKTIFSDLCPEALFEYKFVDAQMEQQFKSMEAIGELATIFAVLAVLVSCLGLYALSTFIAEQRIKEIGIRKVLGATVFTICRLLTGEFLYLIFFAVLIAIPIAYWTMSRWLSNYYYRTTISWSVFLISAVIIIFTTLITVGYQAIKAATANPVKSLRSE